MPTKLVGIYIQYIFADYKNCRGANSTYSDHFTPVYNDWSMTLYRMYLCSPIAPNFDVYIISLDMGLSRWKSRNMCPIDCTYRFNGRIITVDVAQIPATPPR